MVYWPKPLGMAPAESNIRKRFFEVSVMDGYLEDTRLPGTHEEYSSYSPQCGAVTHWIDPCHFNTLPHWGSGTDSHFTASPHRGSGNV